MYNSLYLGQVPSLGGGRQDAGARLLAEMHSGRMRSGHKMKRGTTSEYEENIFHCN